MHREPDVGFDPEAPGSRPGPKAGAKPLRHPGIPSPFFLVSRIQNIPSALCPAINTQPTSLLAAGRGEVPEKRFWPLECRFTSLGGKVFAQIQDQALGGGF